MEAKQIRELKLDGETSREWAERLFEFEYCAECGGDVDDHDYVPFLGHWFARCKQVPSLSAISDGRASL